MPASWHNSFCRPVDGDVVAADQVRGLGTGLRPVTGPRPHMRGKLSGRHRPAARAFLRLRHVLDDLRRRGRRDVGDLMAALRRNRRRCQVRAAPAARRRRALDRLIRIIHQVHRQPGIARLLSRPPVPSLPQRPVAALLPVRAIRRGGTRRRGRVLAGLPLQLLHPGRKPLGLTTQLSDQPVRLCQPRCQLSSRKPASSSGEATQVTPGNGHHSSQPVNDPLWRVASHPGMRAATRICPLALGGWRPGPSRGGGTYTFHPGPPHWRS